VSEEGPELFTSTTGQRFLTPGKETVMNLPPGEVTPHSETVRQLALDGIRGANLSDRQDNSREMLQELKGINKNLGKPKPVESIVNSGHVLIRTVKESETYQRSLREYNMGKWVK
jgi:hypothetical protein